MKANKTRVHHFLEIWALGTSHKLSIMFSIKVNLLYRLYLTAHPEVSSTVSHEAKLFAENLSKNSNLNDQSIISLPVFLSRNNLKFRNIL